MAVPEREKVSLLIDAAEEAIEVIDMLDAELGNPHDSSSMARLKEAIEEVKRAIRESGEVVPIVEGRYEWEHITSELASAPPHC